MNESVLSLTQDCDGDSDQQLTVRFFVEEDRHRHELALQRDESSRVLLRSVESGNDWPTSPPLQQVVRELHEERPVLLGLGLSGRSHWSAAINTTASAAIEFQNACRVNALPQWLGSTYQAGENCDVTATDDRRLVLRSAECSIAIQTDSKTSLQYDPLTKRVQICAALDCQALPSTIAWQYSIAVV